MRRLWLGIDTGGTFTDFVLHDGQRLRSHKVLSTPSAPEEAILRGIDELGITADRYPELVVVHGSTVATNAVLEGKGVRTLYIGNQGLADLLTLGRQARPELYALQPRPLPPPVPAGLCIETSARLAADGSEISPLTAADLAQLQAAVARLAPESVAINLLFSWLDDRHERAIAEAMPDTLFVSRSSAVLPEYREYERGIATWINSWIGPRVAGYLQRLAAALPNVALSVMQSSGDTIAAAQAGQHAVRMLLSGPAGGLSAARLMGRLAGRERLLTFDMGGTSSDVALIDGELQLTREGRIGRWPVAVPMVDMHTIGAGGGSLVWIDGGGLLQVGPASAGADPGPACYGRGGGIATVTDANLLLGRLQSDAFLGGTMRLDRQAAEEAIGQLAARLGMSSEETASGIIRIVNEQMAAALRVISVERGIDPQSATLMAFGGAGGLHVCALAEALNMREAMVPAQSGLLSALGMLSAPRGRQLSRSLRQPLDKLNEQQLAALVAEMAAEGEAALAQEGIHPSQMQQQIRLDLHYVGQSHPITLGWRIEEPLAAVADRFATQHEIRYGHRLRRAIELVNLSLQVTAPPPGLNWYPPASPLTRSSAGYDLVAVAGVDGSVPRWQRSALGSGNPISGPAIVTDPASTLWIEAGWHGWLDPLGNLLLQRQTL
jgi:N-methylhydantoinase A